MSIALYFEYNNIRSRDTEQKKTKKFLFDWWASVFSYVFILVG